MSSFKPLGRKCPICEGERDDCRESLSTGFKFCRSTKANPGEQWRYIKDDAHGFGIWTWGEGESNDRPLKVTFTPAKTRIAIPIEGRDAGYRALIGRVGLSQKHRAEIAKRPYVTQGEIDSLVARHHLFTWQGGEAVPSEARALPGVVDGRLKNRAYSWAIAIPDHTGQILGVQVKSLSRAYQWGSCDEAPVHLPNGELPLGVYGTPTGDGVVNGDEGFLKTALTAARHGGVHIGAAGGHWASSPQQLRAALDALGCTQFVLNADGGAVQNRHVMGAYGRLATLLDSWGIPLLVRWWGQREKIGDVDEITPEQYQTAQLLPWAEFAAIASTPKEKRRRAKDKKELRREQTVARALDILQQSLPSAHRETSGGYLPELPSLPEGLDGFALDASTGGGKTTAIGRDIVAPTRAAFGFTVEAEPRNSLGEQAAKRHGLVHVHKFETDRDSNQALGAMARDHGGMVLCPNSLPRAVQHFPLDTVMVIDEVMATLTEALEGSTLKGRYSKTIELLFAQMRQAQSLHISESNLDQPTFDFVERVSGKRLMMVRHHGSAAPWQVHLSVGGSPSGMFAQMVSSLEQGQNNWLTGTSVDELTAWDIWAKENGIKSLLITGETNDSGRFSDFFEDPDAYLEQNQIQLLLTNQSVQTGLSVERYRFDGVYGYGPGFAPEKIYQQLGRYRLPCPRYVWVPAFITPSRWEKPQKASALAEMGRELSKWAAKGFAPVDADPNQSAIDDYLAARWEIAWAQKVIPGQALTLMLERAGHTVIPWEPAHCKETTQLRKDNREKLARQHSDFHGGLKIDSALHTPEWVKLKRDSETTYRDRCILRKLETLEKFPGIDWDSPEVWYQAWFAPRHYENGEQVGGPVGPGASLWAECGHSAYLQGKAGEDASAIIAQRLRSIKLLPEYGAKLAILAPMRPLAEQILTSGQSSPGCPLIKRLGAMARAVGDDLYRYLRITANDDESDQAIAHKILKKFGLTHKRSTYRKVGRKREWNHTVSAPPLWRPLIEARQKALEALQGKESRAVTDLLEETFNKSVTAPPGFSTDSPDISDLADLIAAARQAGAEAVHQLRQTIKPLYPDLWRAALATAA